MGRLRNEPQTVLVQILWNAAAMLCLPIYEQYKAAAAERSMNDLIMEESHEECEQHSYTIRSTRFEDAPSQFFKSKNDRCSCKARISELDMCAHEIKLRGGFNRSYFKARHFSRELVTGSLDEWNAPENNFIEGLLGFDYEEMETNSVPVDSNFLPENDAPVNQSSFAMIPMKKGGGVKPLAKKQITNILSAVTGGYNNFS